MNVIQTPRPCLRFRPLLDAYVGNELTIETNVDVLRHLEECPECTGATDNRVRTRHLLKRAVATVEVPERLRTSVVSGLGRPAPFVLPRRANRAISWQAIAAGVVLAVLGGLSYGVAENHTARTADLLAIGWTDHSRCALGGGIPDSAPSREAMMASLGGDYNVLLSVADQKLGDYRIRQGHRCKFQGREYAHLVLQKETSLMSISVAKKEPGEEFVAQWMGNRQMASGTRAGIAATGFEAPGHFVFVVSNDSRGDNQQVAEGVAPSIRSMLREY